MDSADKATKMENRVIIKTPPRAKINIIRHSVDHFDSLNICL